MTAVEQYLQELGAALHTRGRARRRLLAECRDHLADAVTMHGEEEAVRRFGGAGELAESFDTEIAVRRASRATIASILGVLAVGASTLALVNAADRTASAVVAWTVVFFAGAQAAAVSAVLAAVRAAAMRHRAATPADVALLCRRNASALTFAAITLFAAGAAVPGHVSAALVMAGPSVAVLAALCVARARSLARKLDAHPGRTVRSPLTDLLAIVGQPDEAHGATGRSPWIGLLVPAVVVATPAAFLWDHLDQGTLGSSLTAAAIEAALIVAGFVLMGPVLGLWSGPSQRSRRLGS